MLEKIEKFIFEDLADINEWWERLCEGKNEKHCAFDIDGFVEVEEEFFEEFFLAAHEVINE